MLETHRQIYTARSKKYTVVAWCIMGKLDSRTKGFLAELRSWCIVTNDVTVRFRTNTSFQSCQSECCKERSVMPFAYLSRIRVQKD